MGAVYRARDPRLGRDVALKVVPPELADPGRSARFTQEARAAAALNHPHIVAVHDVGTARVDDVDTPYVVTELLEGETLRARVSRGRLAVREATELAIQIARGLAAAHEHGIVHRDVKPENVWVARDGTAKVLDFGLAKLRDDGPAALDASTTLGGVGDDGGAGTGPGVVLGTVGYMAPEQVRGETVDHRADVFALGCVLYELLTGQRAFQAGTAVETLSAILNTEPPDLTAQVTGIGGGLERVVRRCLAKAPGQRFQSAKDLAFALEAVSETRSGSGEQPAPPEPRTSRFQWREGLAWVAAVCLALAWLVSNRRAAEPDAVGLHASIDLPGDTTYAGSLALSPRGDVLAITLDQDGDRGIWLRSLGSANASLLEGTRGGQQPFWATDGRSLGFFAQGKLRRIAASGGPAVDVCDVIGQPRGGSWGADGVILFAREGAAGVLQVSADGGTPRQITTPAAGQRHVKPSFLSDGRAFLFTSYRGAVGSLAADVYQAHLDGRPPTLVVSDAIRGEIAGDTLTFQRDRTLLMRPVDSPAPDDATVVATGLNADVAQMASSTTTGVIAYAGLAERSALVQLAWLDRRGQVLQRVGEPGLWSNVVLSPGGDRALLSRRDDDRPEPTLWMADLRSNRVTRFIAEPGRSGRGLWSPDGRRVLYSFNGPEQRSRLFARSADGGAQATVVIERADIDVYPDGWSHDGQFVLYATRNSAEGAGSVDLWKRDLTAAGPDVPFMQTRFSETSAEVSRDNRWVAYASDESGRKEVYVAPFAGGARWQVSTDGGDMPRWNRDGRELFFVEPGGALVTAPVAVEGDALRFGRPERLFDVDLPFSSVPRYDISPDGTRFLVAVPVTEPARATTIGLVVRSVRR